MHEDTPQTPGGQASAPPGANPTRPLSFGEKAVGLTFNPGGMVEVENLKRAFAIAIDTIAQYRQIAISDEAKRLLSIAITEAQSAQMFAVKGVTWTD